jgi:hypothetical protein
VLQVQFLPGALLYFGWLYAKEEASMIRKLVILAIVAAGIFFFYKKFIGPVVEPGLKDGSGTVDFFGKKHGERIEDAVQTVP